MTDLISRQAALAEIDKNREALLSSGMTGAEHILVHYGRRVIEGLPPIEPKKGKWKDGKVKHIENGELRNVRECSEFTIARNAEEN